MDGFIWVSCGGDGDDGDVRFPLEIGVSEGPSVHVFDLEVERPFGGASPRLQAIPHPAASID